MLWHGYGMGIMGWLGLICRAMVCYDMICLSLIPEKIISEEVNLYNGK